MNKNLHKHTHTQNEISFFVLSNLFKNENEKKNNEQKFSFFKQTNKKTRK
jgi:hypothetical protein